MDERRRINKASGTDSLTASPGRPQLELSIRDADVEKVVWINQLFGSVFIGEFDPAPSSSHPTGDYGALQLSPGAGRFFGRKRELRQLGHTVQPGAVVPIVGVQGSGRTELVARYCKSAAGRRLLIKRFGGEFVDLYVDLTGWLEEPQPALRALLSTLGVRLTPSGIEQATRQELIAQAQFAVVAKLRGRHVRISLDNCTDLLATDKGQQHLSALIASPGLRSAAFVMTAHRASQLKSLHTGSIIVHRRIEIGELDLAAAAALFAATCDISRDLAQEVLQNVDIGLLPGPLRSLAALVPDEVLRRGDPVSLQSWITAQAVPLALHWPDDSDVGEYNGALTAVLAHCFMYGKEAAIDSVILEQAVASRALAAFFEYSNDAYRPFGWFVSNATAIAERILRGLDGGGSPASSALATAIQVAADDPPRDLTRELPRYLELAIARLRRISRVQTLIVGLEERLALATVNEPLGPVVLPVRSASEARLRSAPSIEFLTLARTSTSSRNFRDGALKLLKRSPPASNVAEVMDVEILRQALLEIEARFDFDINVSFVRNAILERLHSFRSTDTSHAIEEILLALDAARAAVTLGNYGEASSLLHEIEAYESVCEVDRQGFGYLTVAFAYRRIMQVEVGDAPAGLLDEALASLRAAFDEHSMNDSVVARAAAMTMVRALDSVVSAIREEDLILSYVRTIGAFVEERAMEADRPALIGLYSSIVRRVCREILHGTHRLEELTRVVDLMQVHSGDLHLLSAVGDNRSLLTLVRCLLELANAHSARGEYEKADEMREAALAELEHIVESNPSGAAWFLYLTTLGRVDDLDDSLQAEVDEARGPFSPRLRLAIRQFRQWERRRSANSARVIECNLWILRRRWMSEGSVLGKCAASVEGWDTMPNRIRLAHLRSAFQRRQAVLVGCERRYGLNETLAILRFRNRAQYERALSLYRRTPPRSGLAISKLNSSIRHVGPLPALVLERAAYFQYIWRYSDALADYESLRSYFRDRRVAGQARIGKARALVSIAKYEESSRDAAKAYCVEALETLGSLEGTSPWAATIGVAARIEVDDGFNSMVMDEVVEIVNGRESYLSVVTNDLEEFEAAGELLREEGASEGLILLVESITHPPILIEYAGLLLRSQELSDTPRLEYIRAALRCLDGARVMLGGKVVTPRHDFLVGKALMQASELTRESSPLNWTRSQGVDAISDVNFAIRRFQRAADRSIGSFHALARDHTKDAQELERRLARRRTARQLGLIP